MLSVDGFSNERPVSAATKKTDLDSAAVCLDDEDDFAIEGTKSPTRKWSGKAVAGGLLLIPKLRVSSRRRNRQRAKNSANEVSRSNSFKFERYQAAAAASPEGAEADSTGRRGDGALQREVGSSRGIDIFGNFTIC